MKTKTTLFTAGMLLAALSTGLAQPCSITINTQPQAQANCIGTAVRTSVTADGNAPLSYQWQRSGDQVSWVDVPGAIESIYVILSFQAADVAYYRVIVTNPECSVASQAALLMALSPPTISSYGQPTNFPLVCEGASVTNRVLATGTTPLRYQWRHDGVVLPGKTSSAIILSNLVATDAGGYDVVVTNVCGAATSTIVPLTVTVAQFETVSQPGWTNESCYTWGASWGDYNHDGYPDLHIANSSASWGAYRGFVYRNNGTIGPRPFLKMTAAEVGPIAEDASFSSNGAWVDLNGDGWVDIIVSRSQLSLTTPTPYRVYLNEGDGKLGLTSAGDLTEPTFAFGFALADYDNNGFVDLFQTAAWQDSRWPPINTNRLFRGGADLSFEEVKDSAVCLAQTPVANSSAWGDYDSDGDVDLVVANISNPAFFFQNQGDGQFTRVTNAVVTATGSRLNPAWGDYDNDGDLDLWVTGNPAYLFRNEYPSDFTIALSMSVGGYPSWVDYDNDGWLDMFIALGQGSAKSSVLVHNNQDGTFTNVIDAVTAVGRWIVGAWGDYDNDGFMDVFVTSSIGANALYHNRGNTNHWIKLSLRGVASNASALGAMVRVKANIRGQTIWQMRQVTSGGWPQDDIRPNFGLGDATNAELVRIEWPSGIVQELQNVAANQFITVVESQGYTGAAPQFNGAVKTAGGLELSFNEPAAGARYIVEASTNLVTWTKLLARTSAGGTSQFTDTRANDHMKRFYRLQVP
jgi:hypothetical protein